MLPLTYHLNQVLNALDSEELCSPLKDRLKYVRTLIIGLRDRTGTGGNRMFQTQRSVAKARYPQELYAPQFFSILAKVRDLQSLVVECTQKLDLRMEHLYPMHSLHRLRLFRVKFHATQFLELLLERRTVIEELELEEVELLSGEWALISLPSLGLTTWYISRSSMLATMTKGPPHIMRCTSPSNHLILLLSLLAISSTCVL